YHFCTVTLSARYFDIIKDRLYTFAPKSHARRSTQTALYRICDSLARLVAPILVFTADEIWENLPQANNEDHAASVHLTQFPEVRGSRDEKLLVDWDQLFKVRDEVLAKLEEARVAKVIGSSLEARVVIRPSAFVRELLERLKDDLRYVFIVSQVELRTWNHEKEVKGLPFNDVKVERADGEKCERCWNYSTRVGESKRYPTACERCVAALAEIEEAA
ncbi:MAG: class I tRNA ligase family protein, partial [Acidobacteriota bacterium]|nr:class I tRNA ligase family protein [Acidobacteriota bacterium]